MTKHDEALDDEAKRKHDEELITLTSEAVRQFHLPQMKRNGRRVLISNANTDPVLADREKAVSFVLPARGKVDVPRWYYERLIRDYSPWARRLGTGTHVLAEGGPTRASGMRTRSALARAREQEARARTAEARAKDLELELAKTRTAAKELEDELAASRESKAGKSKASKGAA